MFRVHHSLLDPTFAASTRTGPALMSSVALVSDTEEPFPHGYVKSKRPRSVINGAAADPPNDASATPSRWRYDT